MHRICSVVALTALLPAAASASAPSLDLSWHPAPIAFLQEEPLDNGDLDEAPVDDEAAPTPLTETAAPPVSLETPEPTDPAERQTDTTMEINFRGRRVGVPDSLLDIWYVNEDDPSWADSRDRPDIEGYALGLEYVIKSDNANGIFYVEYIKSQMKEGYWDDVDEPPSPLDGDFIAPTNNLGLAIIGANYAYEAHFVRTSQTNGAFGLSFLVGGGLGVGYMFGDLDRWGPGDDGTPGFVRYDSGDDPDGTKGIPSVFPMVDINAGLRFNFGDRFVLRFEGGLHTLLYYGATAGIMF